MSNGPLNAWDDLAKLLEGDETVEAIVFGEWGWGHGKAEPGYGEPNPPPVPFDKRGILLTAEEAKPLMVGWSFIGGFGAPHCYAVRIWTNKRVFWVTEYDGSTSLDSTERNPVAQWPDMPGG